MRSRWPAVARGAAYAGVATVTAAVSHTVAGDTPSWFGVLVTFVLAASTSTVLAGRRVSWWRLIAAVTIGQAMFHGLFAGMGAPAPVTHHHHDPVALVASTHPHGMLWAHLVAGAITVLALRFGEQALASLADALRFVLRDLAVVPIAPGLPPLPRPEAPQLRSLGLPRLLELRGPPFGSAQPI